MGIYAWDSEMIRFMNQAAKHTKYYEKLASCIAVYLTKESVICDVGCGLGDLSIELAKYCKKVYAIDISQEVISELKEKLQRKKVTNVEALCVDVFQWKPEETVDGTVYCMFGSLEEIDKIGEHFQTSQQFIVRRLAKEHRFKIKEQSPRNHRHSAQGMLKELEKKGRDCDYQELLLSLDQPFRSLEEAVQFFEIYNRTNEKVTLEDVKERLIRQENPEYPYLFPAEKKIGLIRFDTNFDKKVFDKRSKRAYESNY